MSELLEQTPKRVFLHQDDTKEKSNDQYLISLRISWTAVSKIVLRSSELRI